MDNASTDSSVEKYTKVTMVAETRNFTYRVTIELHAISTL